MAGDCTEAEALRLAKAYLEKMGWKYGPKEIGDTARVILDALAPITSHDCDTPRPNRDIPWYPGEF